ncbi:MAG: AAA family ATPase [Magnetococcales bacterium]|nr:AAA family ATPase [Magnetococcales bacterium]
MSLIHSNFTQIWSQLRFKKPHLQYFLESIRIRNHRGIADLLIPFSYPVTVIAGPNGCGKSTILFACACAYEVPGARTHSPANLFPHLNASNGHAIADPLDNPVFRYHFFEDGDRLSMTWSRKRAWSRKTYKGGTLVPQPRRDLYLRTLATLTSPAEVRGILRFGGKDCTLEELDAELFSFAHRVLPSRYRGFKLLSLKGRDLLFAEREEIPVAYSEYHMSAGERALLRLSKEIALLRNALILIDEVEAGLHPHTQQQMMLELQRLALRNDLQIIVTTHSPVVLDSVPPEARIFLERTAENVSVQPAYRDIIQRAFYGRPQKRLSVLCEDAVAEAVILGVLDRVIPVMQLTPDDITVGRDTGKEQFPQHVEALGKFGMLDEFLFVLDGDARSMTGALNQVAARFNWIVNPLFLPGTHPPEDWIYRTLEQFSDRYTQELSAPNLAELLRYLRQYFDNASDRPANIMKARFAALAHDLQRPPEEIARLVARLESERGEMRRFAEELRMAISNWRSRVSG